ncbi:uncharacterized protein LOC129901200 [Solanum dulcamara]|uniref:uncharacterized protein LOC129901200 n=1 Tax=Solanum dulcamara TaxID=45834 RepID=UPI0024861380|nr:uncharacterized protein LOC129901200 [Solanum dulcamara]
MINGPIKTFLIEAEDCSQSQSLLVYAARNSHIAVAAGRMSASQPTARYITPHVATEQSQRGKREEERRADDSSKGGRNKRYATLQAQLNSLLESGNIISPCLVDTRRGQVDGTKEESEGDEE